MELEFRTTLKDSKDIDLYGFRDLIDKQQDYDNNFDIIIMWKAIVYAPENSGITDIIPIINNISIDYDYNYVEELRGDDYNEGERNYKLKIDDFLEYPLSISETKERRELNHTEKKWMVRIEYTPTDEDTRPALVLTRIEIDWQNKEVTITF